MRQLTVVAVAVSLLAAVTAVTACEKKADPAAKDTAATGVAPAMTSGPVAITVGVDGFKPSAVKLQKGMPATLVFTRTTDDTCATEVVFPQLDLKKELPKDKAVAIQIPTDKEQTLTFQCGMGMYKSSVVVAPAN